MPAARAAVPTHRDQQRGGPPPKRFVGEPPGQRVAWAALAAATPAPVVRLDDPTIQYRPRRFEVLAHNFEAEAVQAVD